jgi:iron(II)-dependent oxidoreductase
VRHGTRYGFAAGDGVLLWPTYTNIGIDDRNQLDMFRAMPGGLNALKNVTDAFHARGVGVIWGYNPWDTGTMREPNWVEPPPGQQDGRAGLSDASDFLSALKATGGDGTDMDTMPFTPQIWANLSLAAGCVAPPRCRLPTGTRVPT